MTTSPVSRPAGARCPTRWICTTSTPISSDAVSALVDYETTKRNEGSYGRVEIRGQARSVRAAEITPDPTATLEHAPLVESTGRVYDPDSGTEFTEGVDYSLSRLDGEVTILDSGDMTAGNTCAIDYEHKVTGAYEPPDAPDSPTTLVREVPSIPTERGCEQAALYLYRVVDEPLLEIEADISDLSPSMSVVETITLPDLPTAGRAVEVRGVDQSTESTTLQLGYGQSLSSAFRDLRSQLQAVSRRV